ncbi:WD repeat domain 89 [Rhodotorula toruloides]|uniref:WD repeat domain 89 n=1 Tax=Rhodotorula toruloides TaxID=5286 RepID=A0A511KAX3_RHOTO|nr:WD repeat domain 89 [Rhodotorula toruloides]
MVHRVRLPPPLLYPSTTSTPLRLVAQTPFKPDTGPNPPYVLQTVPFSQGYLFFGSDDTVRAFSPSLQPLAQLSTTQRGITSIVEGAKGSNTVLMTAKDGSVTGWDTRDLSQEAFKLQGKTRAAYLCASQSSDHSALAVGTELHQYEAMIDIWDLRTMQLQHTYTEAHSDDITAVAFHPSPSLSHALLSGSVDGLINTYDYWDIEQQEQLVDFGDVRDVALQPWRTDYVIGAHYNEALGGVCVLAGTIAGDVAVINARDKESWYLEQMLSGKTSQRNYGCKGHRDIVRAAHLDAATSTVVTGGEDGQICLWQV